MRERIVNGTTYFRLEGADDSYLNAEGLAFITHPSTLLHVYMQGNWSRHDHSCLSNDIQSSHKSLLMIFIKKTNFSFVTEYSNFYFTCCTEIHTIDSFVSLHFYSCVRVECDAFIENIHCIIIQAKTSRFIPTFLIFKMDTNNDETPKSKNTDHITEPQQYDSLPNKKRGSDALFRNRMILCTISICLMWASSLRVAAYISSFAINVPQAKILYESCKSTIQIILEEEKRFSSCVDRQMQQCEENLNAAINIETKRVDTEAMRNTAVVIRARTLSKNMTQDFSLLKRSLEEWIAKSQELPSHNNDTCSSQDREIMMSTVFDVNVLRSEALFVSAHYGRESRNAMQKIVNYTKVRSEYDRDYAQKYIASVTDEVRKYAYDTPFPELQIQEEFDKIQGLIDDLLACTTLTSDNNACNFPSFDVGGLSLQWEEYRQETREKWQSVEKYWVDGYDELYLEGKAYADGVFDKFYKFADFGNSEWYK